MTTLNVIQEKENISYSSLTNFDSCPRLYKLANKDKLSKKSKTPETSFGTLIHFYSQAILCNLVDGKEASEKFYKTWKRFCKFYKLDKKFEDLTEPGMQIIGSTKDFFDTNFPGHKVLHIEYKIKTVLEKYPRNFKGYIDLVLEMPDGKIIVADFKTTKSSYNFKKYQDKIKDYQLTLYKYFYSILAKKPLESIETCFIIFEKDLKSKTPISLIKVTSGSVKINNAITWMNNIVRLIEDNKFLKNKLHCRKFGDAYKCEFFKTPHCK